MPVKFSAAPRRIEDFQYELRAIGRRATDLEPVMEVIVDKVLERNARAFETRGATTGTYWAPLKKTTIQRKLKLGVPFPFSPLRRKDELRDSLSERGAEFQVLEVDDTGFYLASEHPAAEYHADGTEYMPARPPLIIPRIHAEEYMRMVKDYVIEGDVDA